MRVTLPFAASALLALALSSPAKADEPKPVRRHGVELGLGTHFAGLGGSYTHRLDRRWAATAGFGGVNEAVAVAGGLRFYPWGPIFTQIGAGPLAVHGEKSYYGPDLTAGIDLNRTRFALTVDAGAALLAYRHVVLSLDLGIGMNFGRSPEDRFTKERP